ncbi:T9SS type A sorting domain-containing protein [Hymenobacter negativus]|uniref:T9SS type A sorting domain-containing protein n=1 Tax=Hymenobacter negativus TaxID=2795026 RepID=A0ABS3QD38_9BACT|nr:T9SS type A sorting domain-containing protein [Hymenobacter negativus]MBO2009097.1 hypothetical protein [Hymenobacter negativus]
MVKHLRANCYRSNEGRITGLLFLLVLLLGAGPAARAQATLAAATVEVSAAAQAAPPRIQLSWKPDAQATSYDVYRWSKGASLTTALLLGQLTSGAAMLGQYVDSTAVVGRVYEYRVRKSSGASNSAEGYVLAGIEVAASERRGTVVLVVDSTHAAYLASDLTQLQADLVGDGWKVLRHDVAPTRTPAQVKSLILADYQADPSQVRTVFLLGHVAVPYAGEINPDGHADHRGAWPADGYYGDMTGAWTDTQVNNPNASRAENRNVPGDGKFDPSFLPRTLQLEVGRVDLSRLPSFGLPERDLLRRYLLKDHQFRHRQFAVAERGLIDDQFGLATGEPLANNGWRNFAPLFGIGAGSVDQLPYFSTLRSASYLWSYACGPGYYTSEGGVGSTSDFASGPVKCVFNMHFGSYFGDWDNADNYLRAALAADGYTLTNCWAGRPDWYFHFMGLGETVGYCARRSQPDNDFNRAFGGGQVHTALLGDPTLRLHVLAPATALAATVAGSAAALAWTASPDPVVGYYVYRAAAAAGPFYRISAQPLAGTTFTDSAPQPGTSYYMVRAVQLKNSASGSYYNLSQGVLGSFTAPTPPVSGGAWLGTSSADWHTPANWSSGVVPTGTGTVPAGTPFAPTVTGSEEVGTLILGPRARLTIGPGARLMVRYSSVIQPAAAGAPATTLQLAPGTATVPGGQLKLLDYTSASVAGLVLTAGTALTVGARAELRLLGSLDAGSAAVVFDPTGRLAFDHDSTVFGLSYQHVLAGSTAVVVGLLRVSDTRETLALGCPVEVQRQVENLGTIITNNRLTLRSTLGQQAMLTPVTAGAGLPRTLGRYIGSVGVQVYVDGSRNAGLGYRHLTVPVTGPAVRNLAAGSFTPVVNPQYNSLSNTAVTPFPTVFTYNQGRVGLSGDPNVHDFDAGWVSPSAQTSLLRTAQGLTVNAPGNLTLSFSGAPILVPFSAPRMDRDDAPDGGWYFLGNPYAAPLDWNSVTADSSRFVSLNAALYVFKSSGQYTGSYASYLPGAHGAPGIGVNGGSSVLPVGQAFFVRTDSAYHTGFLRFTLDDLLTTPDALNVQRGADTRPRLLLALRNPAGTLAHQTAIYFQAGATINADASFDAAYLAGAAQALTLASQSNGKDFSINGLPALTGADVWVPLTLRAAAAGTYELAAETLASLPVGYHAYLHDAGAGGYTDLALSPVVPVTLAAAAPLANRYAVLFTTRARVLATAVGSSAVLVSLSPNPARNTTSLLLPSSLRDQGPITVAVLNGVGQLVATHTFAPNAKALELPLTGLAPGIYTVRVNTTMGPVSRRLAVE